MKRLLQLPSSRSLPPGFGFLPLDPGSLPPGPGSCHWVMGPFPQVWVLPPVTGPCPRVWDLPPSSRPSDFLCLKINGNLPFIRLIPAITTMKMTSYALCSTPTTPHTGPGHDLQLTERDTPCSSKHIEAPCSLQHIDYSTICFGHEAPRTDGSPFLTINLPGGYYDTDDIYWPIPHQAQGLQPPEHLSSDLLHYADDPPGHAGLHCCLVQVSKAQPCLAAQYRSMSGMEYRSMSDEGCWSTEGECCRSTVVSEYRSTELVSGSTVVKQNRATHKWCCRSMRSALPCGSNVPNLQDLVRIAIEFPCCSWYSWACT
ncbi:hypothetical protein DY000_02049306 [Brassica cretica]|uniref:Uncharacterized protein n=1 Tax=Brassica cretica TaxID=69181 RepID=A0ABQ7END0_BRACR|nr:hypothetical protein DY000_02049306 [Brassica cretica]